MNSPLVPSNCELTDFPFMPVDVRRLLNSETWILGNGEERSAAMTLWLESWQQVPAGSIPSNDKLLAHLSRSGSKWSKVKARVLKGWVLCDDDRYYHPVVAEKALEAWIEKLYAAISGNNGNAKRWEIKIDNTSLEANLRDAIVRLKTLAPRSKALKKKIVKVVESQSQANQVVIALPSPPDSGCNRNREGEREGEREGLLSSSFKERDVLKNFESLDMQIIEPEYFELAAKDYPDLPNSVAKNLLNSFGKYYLERPNVIKTDAGWVQAWSNSLQKYAPNEIQKLNKPKQEYQAPQRQTDTTKIKDRQFDDFHDAEVYSNNFTAGHIRKNMSEGETPDQCVLRLVREKLSGKAGAV